MKRLRGFKIGHRFVKIFKWIIRSRRIQTGKRQCLTGILNPVKKICSLARCLRRGANRLCGGNKPGQARLGNELKPTAVPKGHLVVHVGESGDDTRRVVVPVIYFNHPLFGQLLEQAERVYGFEQSGRITIPCRVSDFEKVQTRIAAWDRCRQKRTFKIL
ncbi:SAUR-like auxin-responsive protein family [Raphanus sativus]|uniref:Auxin-responsive protein SAUR36 n=1 Tax=Raphanus sativus TaxID=3726 RepID=A0A6J0MA01_RAPSA|nr:auxin-responsive protein SAUR36 [Raphanus sativus]KAJ4912904.1 SAUR-like auxin-responsive protein family [Raphanus sativus]